MQNQGNMASPKEHSKSSINDLEKKMEMQEFPTKRFTFIFLGLSEIYKRTDEN